MTTPHDVDKCADMGMANIGGNCIRPHAQSGCTESTESPGKVLDH
jgi:hypothetical protein